MRRNLLIAALAALSATSAVARQALIPVRLHSGVNKISNIAGDGKSGSINLNWRENGNAWGYDIYTVMVGNSIVTHDKVGGLVPRHDSSDSFVDRPHTGDDMITSVRFARGVYLGRTTLIALIATRNVGEAVPDPAITTISIYALQKNTDGIGTPYEFVRTMQRDTRMAYCNADMALQTELGFPVASSYSGPRTTNGC